MRAVLTNRIRHYHYRGALSTGRAETALEPFQPLIASGIPVPALLGYTVGGQRTKSSGRARTSRLIRDKAD